MLNHIRLLNFKSFQDAQIPLGPLTLLAGLNGMGKSSLIQAILVLRQSALGGEASAGRLQLSGELADLGAGSDVLFEDATEDVIEFEINSSGISGDKTANFRYLYDRVGDELSSAIDGNTSPSELAVLIQDGYQPFSPLFSYVHAERLGPRKTMPLSEARARAEDIGPRGEYLLHVLLAHGDRLLEERDPRLRSGADSRKLSDQVTAWLQEVSPGSRLDIEAVRSADIAIGGFSYARDNDVSTKKFRPTNVGFGLSYSLAVIVSLIMARRGSLVILENPEAHVHPRGQTMLGRLAARAVNAGVQVIVETHSDHFMDGVRIEVRLGGIPPESCKFHYFNRSEGRTAVMTPEIDAQGRLSTWPDGFFDQRDQNLATIISGIES